MSSSSLGNFLQNFWLHLELNLIWNVLLCAIHTVAADLPGPLWATMAPETALIQLCISSGLSAWWKQQRKSTGKMKFGKWNLSGIEIRTPEWIQNLAIWYHQKELQWECEWTTLFELSKSAYLDIKRPWCGDNFKQIISHHDVTTAKPKTSSIIFIWSITVLSHTKACFFLYNKKMSGHAKYLCLHSWTLWTSFSGIILRGSFS